jgi:DNA repair ATPase RecN
MTDLTIRYDNGQMIIHLEEFLACRNISKVRKLLKIIARSDTPEMTEQIQSHIEHRIKGLDDVGKISANQYVKFVETVKQVEQEVNRLVQLRSRYKKKSDEWTHYNDRVKESRERLREVKASMRNSKKEFDDMIRDKKFFEKLLSEVFS